MSSVDGAGALLQYCERLEELYVYYVEAVTGFRMVADHIERITSDPQHPSTLANRNYYGARGTNPNDPEAKYVRITTLESTLGRCGPSGSNNLALVRSIIMVAWRNGIQSPVFGDLNKYRQAIAHAGGLLDKRTEVFSFVEVGSAITLNEEQLVDLIEMLVNEVKQIATVHFGHTLDYKFLKTPGFAEGQWVEVP